MEKEIRILMLEDTPSDAELNLRELKRNGIPHSARRVETEDEFHRELEALSPDLILADYSLPEFDGLTALAISREKCPDIPFIFVTGAMGEEVAIESLKKGATDYVLKHRLSRLVPSVKRALREAEDRRRQRETEQALRKETAERMRTLEELREKERLLILQSRQAAMGEMVNFVAHQWRQPLNTLSLIVQFMESAWKNSESHDESMNETAQQAMNIITHMSRTIDDFRNFFRPDGEKVSFMVHEKIRNTLVLVGGSLKASNIEVDLDAEEDLMATGYPNEYCQVLMNIINNARDALEERKVASPYIKIQALRDGCRTVTTISDNAGGIPVSIMDRIFEPYFTTKDREKGTGIGLYMSRAIIEERMSGRLSASNIGMGAEFRIEI